MYLKKQYFIIDKYHTYNVYIIYFVSFFIIIDKKIIKKFGYYTIFLKFF